MSRLSDAVEPVTRNPLRVLGLSPAATQRDVEREGGRLLALIAAGLDAPPVPRTADDVRAAMAELRDPSRRAMHELFALSPGAGSAAAFGASSDGWHAGARPRPLHP